MVIYLVHVLYCRLPPSYDHTGTVLFLTTGIFITYIIEGEIKMAQPDKAFKELFNQSDCILICDVRGKVLYYQDYNDQINMIRDENAIGRSILRPFAP